MTVKDDLIALNKRIQTTGYFPIWIKEEMNRIVDAMALIDPYDVPVYSARGVLVCNTKEDLAGFTGTSRLVEVKGSGVISYVCPDGSSATYSVDQGYSQAIQIVGVDPEQWTAFPVAFFY